MTKTKIAARVAPTILVAVFALSPFFAAEAASKPTIRGITGKKTNSVVLEIKYSKFASKKAKIQVEVIAAKNANKSTKTHTEKLGSTGRVNVKVKDLKTNMEYKFRVRLKKTSGGSYSGWSGFKSAATKK